MPSAIPVVRVAPGNSAPLHRDRGYVLYWMIAQRRTVHNFALQHAVHHARTLGKPLLVFEALRCDYPWASDRLHRFVLDGMADNRARCEEAGVRYFPYLERAAGAGKGLLHALSERACLVVTDEFPSFFLPRMVRAAGAQLDVRLDVVDGNGLMPLRVTEGEFQTAYAFRRFLQKNLREHLSAMPEENSLRGLSDLGTAVIARDVSTRWPEASRGVIEDRDGSLLAGLPIDHEVRPTARHGGSVAGAQQARHFLDHDLARYQDDRNLPEEDVQSALSPYLHFGHVSAHQVVSDLLQQEGWTPDALSSKTRGHREGWWGVSPCAESFLDQIVTWRELGYVFNHHRPKDYDRYDSLPDWAFQTLAKHASDRRDPQYTLEQLDTAATHDPLWNAAQTQLVREGRIHNYLRMLWGKKILEWSPSPEAALEVMIELNNRYALDGRNPNSHSGIFWTLGRFDRAWGPERRIFGTVRYMSSANTARKVKVKDYIRRYGKERPV